MFGAIVLTFVINVEAIVTIALVFVTNVGMFGAIVYGS